LDFNKVSLTHNDHLILYQHPHCLFSNLFNIPFKSCFTGLCEHAFGFASFRFGVLLLLAFSPNYWFGSFIDQYLGIRLAFSFLGILIGSIIFNLPFMVNSIQNGFSNLPLSLKDASYTLGKSRMTTIFRVLLPNIKPALLTGVCLTFAHTIGEFGVILMIGGNIPGKTRVAALAVYDEVQALNFDMANKYAIFLFLFSFVVLLFIYSVNREFLKWKKF
jgi:molybdate transport system permease protein